ncbi:CcoQ/FixQ family Cbb3-type cytochrome c oxidase assembly chaperone [Croceivirga thetidis]|uniref:CcoQ/FixQ family Cbb3-type cytochrome c oxidase assembly chaperone n=1 Tax=Croceivirga thetidis TaxID=2721623 RepID=A0ABX1GMX0_9FLAO|nr:CcoQ/FixQ family Cbb3-type cytochrome c oxidase assembly chaperone [Croceivirga thetidis]NKI31267.1 CcoQ/FixQ family Cbb3-type cytochrome c oxidase assembly chaperone [Croceivirga thetidis]
MLKFVKNHMESIEGIATYPMISLLIFFVFFSLLFWWVFTASKAHIKEMGELPLDNDNQKTRQHDF